MIGCEPRSQLDDGIARGLIPELLGRLPITTSLMPMTQDVLINILTEPKNAIIRQYQHFFAMEGAELEFTPGALAKLAQRALARDTGARALRSVLEEVMLELMYDLPDLDNTNARYIIDAAAIEQRKPLAELRVSKKSA